MLNQRRLQQCTTPTEYVSSKLPAPQCLLVSRQFLSAGRNRISHIPASIVKLTALKSLIMYQNRLGDRGIPDSLCDMSCLRELRLSYNAISRLPYRFSSAPIRWVVTAAFARRETRKPAVSTLARWCSFFAAH